MIKGLAAWVLNNYLGKYVENLNTDQLSIALSQGLVELENLPLRRDALRGYDLALEVRTGFIGKVKLQVPVRQIRSAPWIIELEQLCVVIGPAQQSDDYEGDDAATRQRKLDALDEMEAVWRQTEPGSDRRGFYAASYASWVGFGTGVVASIVENLQLRVKDVHVRYEDSCGHGAGFTIRSLVAESCDADFTPRFVTTGPGAAFKLVELADLSVYWSPDEPPMADLGLGELAVAMSKPRAARHVLLSPLCARAGIRRQRTEQPIRSKHLPRISCDITVDSVNVTLSDRQYAEMVACGRNLYSVARIRRQRRWRPAEDILQDPRAWWRYAGACLVPGLRRTGHCDWPASLERARENVRYVDVCARLLANPAVPLSTEDRQLKDEIEMKRGLDELVALREVSMLRARPPPPPSAPAPQMEADSRGLLLRWFPQWWGWNAPEQDNQEAEDELLLALDASSLHRDTIFARIDFKLARGSITLCAQSTDKPDAEKKPMLELQLTDASHWLECRPRSQSHALRVTLGSLTLRDHMTPGTRFPLLISPRRTAEDKDGGTLLDISYSLRPWTAANAGCVLRAVSAPLDVVHNPGASAWLTRFFTAPHRAGSRRYQRVKRRTKERIMRNWDNLMRGHQSERRSWEVELDISAPQLIVVERFDTEDAALVAVDFGRFHFTNRQAPNLPATSPQQVASAGEESDEEECFMTPCSTPPGSEASDDDTAPIPTASATSQTQFSDRTLHDKLYDSWQIRLSQLQVLVARSSDGWRRAQLKRSSPLHALDRFDISVVVERRVVFTADPGFPALALSARLPTLAAHVSEPKLAALTVVISQALSSFGSKEPTPPPAGSEPMFSVGPEDLRGSAEVLDGVGTESSRLLMLQFSVDNLALEVQSRGRSIAELQVSGVKATLMKRPYDANLSLSVHGLLLVDALQTFGTDFELLLASHKHVGMDSVSGVLFDSEPTSPTSPASPSNHRVKVASPTALSQALDGLVHQTHGRLPKSSYESPEPKTQQWFRGGPSPPPAWGASSPPPPPIIHDAEALITVEVVLVTRDCPSNDGQALRVVSVQVNNLDVIANQETIVELLGFARRVFPSTGSQKRPSMSQASAPGEMMLEEEVQEDDELSITPTYLTFDLRRLNLLLLRAVDCQGVVVGRKVATATMTEARVQITIGSELVADGSLGGLQLLDLTPEGSTHQRVLSVGRDPLAQAPLYRLPSDDSAAFSFHLTRSLKEPRPGEPEVAEVTLGVASAWYTHSPRLAAELAAAAHEFTHFLSAAARSTAEVALGLVQGRAEVLAATLGVSRSRSNSVSMTPRKRARVESGCSGSEPEDPANIEQPVCIRLHMEVDSPVLVLPRNANSGQVLVARLGKMSVSNVVPDGCSDGTQMERYSIDVRDMSLFSLDTRPVLSDGLPSVQQMYSTQGRGKPLLHDTVLRLVVERRVVCVGMLLESDPSGPAESLEISGSVASPLKVSLTRRQYEQVLDTFASVLATPHIEGAAVRVSSLDQRLPLIREEAGPVLQRPPEPVALPEAKDLNRDRLVTLRFAFELPEFTVELRADLGHGETGLVQISFRDFDFLYHRAQRYETSVQVSLRSLLIEDLLLPPDARLRVVASCSRESVSRARAPASHARLGRSCPEIGGRLHSQHRHGSLPARLGQRGHVCEPKRACPITPPPSPSPEKLRRPDNLVHVTIAFVDADCPDFATKHRGVSRSVAVEMNSLDIVVSAESWVVVLDFFGLSEERGVQPTTNVQPHGKVDSAVAAADCTELDIRVRGVTLALARRGAEFARATASHLAASSSSSPQGNIVQGSLGGLSLLDTSPGSTYRERFLTAGREAFNFRLTRYIGNDPSLTQECDSKLRLQMASVVYVHTQRFVAQIMAFFREFSQLQAVLRNASSTPARGSRLKLDITAGSPRILLPLSSHSKSVLVADLGKLRVSNTFRLAGDSGTIDTPRQSASFRRPGTPNQGSDDAACLLDVMLVELEQMDLFAGRKVSSGEKADLEVGALSVCREGPALLQEKCQLSLQVDRNLDAHRSKHVPDTSVRAKLSALSACLDLQQYQLIRGLLAYNIGENLQELAPSDTQGSNLPNAAVSPSAIWTTLSVQLELTDVALRLQLSHGLAESDAVSGLACIHFIRSRLLLETFSDLAQDVDLVSQEILITDTRFAGLPANKRRNAFTTILAPLRSGTPSQSPVQAELHHRRRRDFSKFTILLNSMRLMAVLDWWEAARDFILEAPNEPQQYQAPSADYTERTDTTLAIASTLGIATKYTAALAPVEAPFELKLNISDSQVVLLEDPALTDTNALILKATAVVSYRPRMLDKPLSCNLNRLELSSCSLAAEEETALSIVDPVTVNVEVTRRPVIGPGGLGDATLSPSSGRALEIHAQALAVRVSLADLALFTAILKSLPAQTAWGRSQKAVLGQPANRRSHISKLSALGFSHVDCAAALEACNGHLDDAALWLTSNATPTIGAGAGEQESALACDSIEVKAGSVSVIVMDDCWDADVPLAELALSRLQITQAVGGAGSARAEIAGNYFNRELSGWEAFLEPWRCCVAWETALGQSLARNRLRISLSSEQEADINITSALIALYHTTRDRWTRDASESSRSPRRRQPFVPFELRNRTGSTLAFRSRGAAGETGEWLGVEAGESRGFSFEARGKARNRDARHQLEVKVQGWVAPAPVSVDRVGVFFRNCQPENIASRVELTQARLVFEVRLLKDTARKQVTVRSALQIHNALAHNVEVRLENQAQTRHAVVIPAGGWLAVPLNQVAVPIWVKPVTLPRDSFRFSCRPVGWAHVTQPGAVASETIACLPITRSGETRPYRFVSGARRGHFPVETGGWTQPGHVIRLSSPVVIGNLLPVELHVAAEERSSRVLPGATLPLNHVDLTKSLLLTLTVENYPSSGQLTIPAAPVTAFSCRVRLGDANGRKLNLAVKVATRLGGGVVVNVSAAVWLCNRTELPLVFRQEGAVVAGAGQFEEHECARMVAPLLFSLDEPDGACAVSARIGTNFKPDGQPQWCQPFHVSPGVQTRRLRVSSRDSRPDFVYVIGVEVRRGRGRYRDTRVVSLLPRYQLHNRSRFTLQLAQRCFATDLTDPGFQSTYLLAVPNCSLPFHWPRLDKDPLLCLRLVGPQFQGGRSQWSGGFRVDCACATHLTARDESGAAWFLRVEVVPSRAAFVAVFSDAFDLPPPVRIDNFSDVALSYHQTCCPRHVSTVRAHSLAPVAWDEPTLAPCVTLAPPGGNSHTYDLNMEGEAQHLTYENFVYVAMTATFHNAGHSVDPLDVESQQLVLSSPDGQRVILQRKQAGARSQLWRMSSEGHLLHEGSSPPRDSHQRDPSTALVLDIATPAPQPSQASALALRRKDRRRLSTQTWKFTADGRLVCGHVNMCVQARGGLFGLREGSEVVLGPPSLRDSAPIEQRVSCQRLRPGSGFLTVSVLTDGPTRVIRVRDVKEDRLLATADERDWAQISQRQRPAANDGARGVPTEQREIELDVRLPAVGVSLVSTNEELLFARFAELSLRLARSSTRDVVQLAVADVQIDNQQLEAASHAALWVAASGSSVPAVFLDVERIVRGGTGDASSVFSHLLLRVRPLALTLEERLVLKMFTFVGWSEPESEVDEIECETQRLLSEALSVTAQRYYFGTLQLQLSQVRLSVVTSSKLTAPLSAMKKQLGLRLIRFEDAAIELQPFVRSGTFETGPFLALAIVKHYKEELKWQAASILGSVDFLGSPLGLVQDVSEGVSGLLRDGSVVSLVKSVTHGLSNSAAKVTESLSDGLGRVISDDSHEETRLRLRQFQDGSSSDHLVAGLKGLGFGLLGGVTSVFTQSYDGAARQGVQGFLSGFGKGLLGTVTKPVVGVLDLATETASAVRDSSRTASHRGQPTRLRLPRCAVGPGGLLPCFSRKLAQGQEFLYAINDRTFSERFVWYEMLRCGSEDLRLVVSSEWVRVFTCGAGPSGVVLACHLDDVERCTWVSPGDGDTAHYIEVSVRDSRPRVRCDSAHVARAVADAVNAAKRQHDDTAFQLLETDDNDARD